MEVREAAFDVGRLIESRLASICARAEKAGAPIRVEVDDGLPLVRADAAMVRRILVNLLSNAIKFTPGGGEITLAAGRDPDGGVFLSVTDTGIGMDETDIETALTEFGQVDSSLARRYDWVGLGLPLANSMARLNGAELALTSEPGVGTTATIRFPSDRVARRDRAALPTPAEASAALNSVA